MVVITIMLLFILFLAGFLHIYFSVPSKKLYSKLHSFLIANSNNSSSSSSSNLAKSTTTKKQETITNYPSCDKKGEDLKGVFATFDKNGDGFITKQELSESLKNIRIFMSENEVEEMIVKLDSNGDGLIDFEEFCILCKAMGSSGGSDGNYEEEVGVEKGSDDEELKEAFDVFDKDKDGMISVEELGSVLSCLGLNEGKRLVDCKEMIKKVDMDGDGMVNFDEFKMMMKGTFGCNGGNDNKQVSIF